MSICRNKKKYPKFSLKTHEEQANENSKGYFNGSIDSLHGTISYRCIENCEIFTRFVAIYGLWLKLFTRLYRYAFIKHTYIFVVLSISSACGQAWISDELVFLPFHLPVKNLLTVTWNYGVHTLKTCINISEYSG